MRAYLDLLDNILTKGRKRETPRNGASTLALFGEQLRFNLADGFPLVTTRKVYIRILLEELLWFLSGSTNNEVLRKKDVHIWDDWALPEDVYKTVPMNIAERVDIVLEKYERGKEILFDSMSDDYKESVCESYRIPRERVITIHAKGELGPIYGRMWRAWPNPDGTTVDQIAFLVKNLKERPYSRRHVISAWNPSVLPDETYLPIENIRRGNQCLAPCHTTFQFSVEPLIFAERYSLFQKMPNVPASLIQRLPPTDENQGVIEDLFVAFSVPRDRLSCKLFCRSQDVPVGTVFNIASYAAFVLMLCQLLNFAPGDYIHSMGDSHIYANQIDGVKEQLKRTPGALPELQIKTNATSLFDYQIGDFSLHGYYPQAPIRYPVTA